MSHPNQNVEVPTCFLDLYLPYRYKVYWGGRGSGKSWNFARALIAQAYTTPLKILCVREYQTSIADSVHALLKLQIKLMELEPYFNITDRTITSSVGSEFIFKGLRFNADEIKSTEGVDRCWAEEAHRITEESWKFLIPTIRKDGSEIWVSFNQHDDTDPTYERLVTKCPTRDPKRSLVRAVTWEHNPYFNETLNEERLYLRDTDPDAYDWVWGLQCRRLGSAVIFKGKFVVETFEEPPRVRPRYGLDFGFANDPNHLVRFYITEDARGAELWITHEQVGHQVELDDLPAFLDGGKSQDGDREWVGIPGIREWPIKADSARPETISYLRRKGFQIAGAEKWKGCVEDGIAHLKRYRKIHIHERCPRIAQEARLYSYEVDRKTGDVLPVIQDKHNHGWDATRYGHDGEIQHAGGLGVWAKLAKPGR